MVSKEDQNLKALSVFKTFGNSILKKGLPGILAEFDSLKSYQSPKKEKEDIVGFRQNPSRNRDPGAPCFEATRFKLVTNVPPETDYIHANTVKMGNHNRKLIITQIPFTTETIADFWRLVYDANATFVCLMHSTEEKSIPNAFWPKEMGKMVNYGITAVSLKKKVNEDRFEHYVFEVLADGCSNSVVSKFFIFKDWGTKGVTESALALLRALHGMPKNTDILGIGLFVCHYGRGPSATAALVESAKYELLYGMEISMPEMFKKLRDRRYGAIENKEQYAFVHVALLSYIAKKDLSFEKPANEFYKDFKKLIAKNADTPKTSRPKTIAE